MSYFLTACDIETIADPGLPPSLMPNEDDIKAPSNWKDPEKIAAYEAEKRDKLFDGFGLSPITNKILMIGFLKFDVMAPNADPQVTIFSSQQGDYKEFLQQVADYMDSEVRHYVSYNGKKFDFQNMLAHFALNRIRCSTNFGQLLQKYKNHPHWDLFLTVGEHGSLEKWAHRFGGNPVGKGSQVASLYNQGRFDEISDHLTSDLIETARLASFFAPYVLEL